jgi:hypothetical protein
MVSLLRRLDRPAEAAQPYRAAIDESGTDSERDYLKHRIAELTEPSCRALNRRPRRCAVRTLFAPLGQAPNDAEITSPEFRAISDRTTRLGHG